MQRFDRVFGLLLYLRSEQRTSAATLARHFGVSTRTIHRDVEMLSALGVPVYAERGRSGGIRLLPGYFLPPIMLNSGEAASVILGLTLLRSLRSHPYDGELETARRKVLAALPEHVRERMADAERSVGFEAAPPDTFHPERDAPVPQVGATKRRVSEGQAVTMFLQALFERQRVHLRYTSPYRDGPSEVVAEPQAVFWDRDRWYLVGEPVDSFARQRLWRADRVVRIAAAGASSSTGDVDVRRLLDGGWLRPAMERWADEAPVTIELSTGLRECLLQDWYFRHARFESLPAGRALMTYGEDDPERAFALVRWLGPEAELLSPAIWRERLRDELARMANVYGAEQ